MKKAEAKTDYVLINAAYKEMVWEFPAEGFLLRLNLEGNLLSVSSEDGRLSGNQIDQLQQAIGRIKVEREGALDALRAMRAAEQRYGTSASQPAGRART